MILILAEPDDVHALAVHSCIVRYLKKDAVILNVADYPTKWNIDFFVGARNEYRIKGDTIAISSAEVEGVWRRRIMLPTIHEAVSDPEVRNFCFHEAHAFFIGFLGAVENVVNTESSEHLASRKAYQLKVATDVGLRVPDTLVSSEPASIRDFYDKHSGNVIFKVLTPTKFQFSETRVLQPADLQFIDSAIFAPTIYQERIVAQSHLRITLVDSEMFSAEVNVTRQEALLDWRLDPDPIIREAEIPSDVGAKLLLLMQRLGIRYGAVDMVVSRAGEPVFLEVNPGGQFLFVEIHTGQPISLAVARALGCRGQD
jgi:hypothetical protein